MNSTVINARQRDSLCINKEHLILILTLLFTGSFIQMFAQGSTCATAQEVYIVFNAVTISANGPNSGNGAENSCYSTSSATHAGWYKYTPSFNGHIRISSCGGGVDTRLSVFTGTCDELTCVAFSDDACAINSGSYNWASNLPNLPVVAGTTYYIQWDNRWSSSGFDWILWEYPGTPANDDFCNATLMNCGSSVLGTTYGSSPSGEGSSCAYGFDTDVYYKINALAGVEYTITLHGTYFDGILSTHYISSQVEECDYNTQLTMIDCANNASVGGTETITFTRSQNQEILIRVSESYYTGHSGFYVGVSCIPPANDECSNATNLVLNASPKSGDNRTATASTNLPISCGTGGDKSTDADVWYKFVAPSSGKITIETFAPGPLLGGGINDTQLQVFDACGGEVLFCNDDRGTIFFPILMAKITIPCDAYTPYETYYIQVDGGGGARGRFRISVVTSPCSAPANDDCSNAIILPVNEMDSCPSNQTLGTTSGATASSPDACESSAPDVYYFFNSGSSGEVIINLHAITATDLVLSLFKESCSASGVNCLIGINQAATISVTPFTNYYLRVHTMYGAPGSFNICIERTAPEIAALNGSITGWLSNCHDVGVTVKLFEPGTATQVYSYNALVQSDGSFSIPELATGTFDVFVKVGGYLAKGIQSVAIVTGDNSLAVGEVKFGDLNGDNVINFLDAGALSQGYFTSSDQPNYNALADFDCNGAINFLDAGALSQSYFIAGDTAPLPGDQ